MFRLLPLWYELSATNFNSFCAFVLRVYRCLLSCFPILEGKRLHIDVKVSHAFSKDFLFFPCRFITVLIHVLA